MSKESYVCNCSGTNTTCFTFFTDFDRNFPNSEIIEAVVMAIVFLVAIGSNALVMYVAHVMRRSPGGSVTNYFVANLALADLLFALTIPTVIAARVADEWKLGSAGCKIATYMQCLCGSVIMWSLCLISIERFRLIVVPPFRPRLTSRQVALMIGGTWITLMALYAPIIFLFDQESGTNDHHTSFKICTMVPKYSDSDSFGIVFVFVVCTIVFVVPTSILIYNYIQIYRKLSQMMQRQRQQRARFSTVAEATTVDSIEPSSDMSSVTERGGASRDNSGTSSASITGQTHPSATLDNQQLRRPAGLWSRARSFQALAPIWRALSSTELCGDDGTLRTPRARLHGGSDPCLATAGDSAIDHDPPDRHLRALRILILEVMAYLIMWLPVTVLMMIIYFESKRECDWRKVASHHFFYCLLLAYVNACVNPILYGALNDKFRDSLRNQLSGRCKLRCSCCNSVNLWWQRLCRCARSQTVTAELTEL